MRLLHRLYWVSDTVRDVAWLHRRLAIGPRDVVLDVGSGGSPNLRSNVLCDKFPWDGTERHGQPIALDRPFVLGDIEALPFADHAFDFVICSHVLEHVPDPARAVAELQRVAPRGYIETPAAAWERLAPFPFHRWMVAADGDGLRFTAKRAAVQDPELSAWFAEMQGALGLGAYIWGRRRAAGVYTSLSWEDTVPVTVIGADAAPDAAFAAAGRQAEGDDGPPPPAGPVRRALDRYGRHLRRHSDPLAGLGARLRCPSCRGELTAAPDGYRCRDCGTEYPSRDAPFPVLLRL